MSEWKRLAMRQIFPRSANDLAKATIIGAVLFVAATLVASYALVRSPYWTNVGVVVTQPVQFNHEHHVGQLGIQCRYCHTTATQSESAGMPATHTCMTCHSQVWTDAPALEPVRASYATGQPIQWNRVTDLGDFVYFNHSIHVAKGVGCVTCHGQVDQMPLTFKTQTMTMAWCLDCHRAPEQYLRPREAVYDLHYQPPVDQLTLGQGLVQEYGIHVARLTDCSTCHR